MTLIFGLCQAIFQFFARPGNVDNYGLNTPPEPMEGPS